MAACKQCMTQSFFDRAGKKEAVENGEIPDYLEFFEK